MAAKKMKKATTKKSATAGKKKASPKKKPAGRKATKTAAKKTPKRAAKKTAETTKKRGAPAGRGSESGIEATNLTPEDERFVMRNKEKLSKTTLRAKWINSPDEHEDQPGQSLATRNRDVIEHWAEERQAVPATVGDPEKYEGRPGVLRFDFPGDGDGNLQEIDWDEWFKTFDARSLVFLFQEHVKSGKQSNFFRFDSPVREEA
jgi:hypothetical protein